MTLRFTHDTLGQRVRFAPAAVTTALAEEVEHLDARSPMLIASGRDRDLIASISATVPIAHHHDEVAMHVPVEVAEKARAAAAEHEADALICVGGGSATGLAKAVALTSGLPIIAVPTTYSGSEATPVWGLTENNRKQTGTDPVVLPRTVVYDSALLAGLPVQLAVSSGLNAVAHCVDSMWAPHADPINQAMAVTALTALDSGIRAIAHALSSGENTEIGSAGGGVDESLYGAYLAGVAFASAGSGLHHKIAHVLGGMFGLPHSPTHAIVLPYVLAFNAPHAPTAAAAIAAAFGSDTASAGLAALRAAVDAPVALRELDMPESGIDAAAAAVVDAAPPSNPSPVTVPAITALLRDAWSGKEISS